MNRRDLVVGLLDGLVVTVLPDGRVRVEPQGVLAHPDMDPPVEEYPSLMAFMVSRRPANGEAPRRLSADAEGRLIDLPDALRAWAREDPRVRLHLTPHVVEGIPLAACLVALADELAEGDVGDLRAHRTAQAYPPLRALLASRTRRP